MFARAALASASREAAASPSPAPVDLDSASPGCPRPVAFGEDVNGAPESVPEWSVTAPPSAQEVSAPAPVLSPEQELFWQQLFSSLQAAFTASAASGTIRTYESALRAIVPKVTWKLGTEALPLISASQFFSFFGSAVPLGPKSPSLLSGQLGVRWSYAKLFKAAAAYWRVVLGGRAAFGSDWTPHMGASWAGIKRGGIHGSLEKSPLLLSDVRSLCVKAETSAARLRRAVGGSDLPPIGAGLGAWVDEALYLRCAVSVSLASFGVRRASEIASLTKADVAVGDPAGVGELKVRCRKNDQLGVGQVAHIVELPAWNGACPMSLLADWLWPRDWLSRFRDRDGRFSAPPVSAPLFVGPARARFGLRMAASGNTAAWKTGLDCKNLSPRKGGARLYVMDGMAREATQELGGWKSPEVMDSVFSKVRSGEVVPEMRSAGAKACNLLEAASIVEDLGRDVGSESDDALGSLKGAAARIW